MLEKKAELKHSSGKSEEPFSHFHFRTRCFVSGPGLAQSFVVCLVQWLTDVWLERKWAKPQLFEWSDS